MKTQEQSSISQVKKPKLEIPRTELVGVKKEEKVTNEKTKGGIIMGQDTLEKQQVASQCGNI